MNVSISSTMTLQCVGVTARFLLSVLFWTDPVFVGSAYIEESQPIGNPVGDDDKIYFFFSEAGKEFDFFDNTIVSRIARVCKVRHLRSPHKNSRAKAWGPGRLELPVNNPQPNNYLKNKAGWGAPSPPLVWTHFWTMHHACVDTMEMCQRCVWELNWTNMFWTDLVSLGLTRPLLLAVAPPLFPSAVSSPPSPPNSLTMSAALIHPSNSLSFEGRVSIQRGFAEIRLILFIFILFYFHHMACCLCVCVFFSRKSATLSLALFESFTWALLASSPCLIKLKQSTPHWIPFQLSSEQLSDYESAWCPRAQHPSLTDVSCSRRR